MEKHTVCHESHEQSIGIRTQGGLRLERWVLELWAWGAHWTQRQWGIIIGDPDSNLAAVWKDWRWGAVWGWQRQQCMGNTRKRWPVMVMVGKEETGMEIIHKISKTWQQCIQTGWSRGQRQLWGPKSGRTESMLVPNDRSCLWVY